MKNETLFITRNKLLQQEEILKTHVERAVEDKNQRMEWLENELKMAREKIISLNLQNENSRVHLEEMKVEKDILQGQIENLTRNKNLKEYVKDTQQFHQKMVEKEAQYKKLVIEWNQMQKQMEEVISENRLFREWLNIPENFGVDLSKIDLLNKEKIEDYKAKVRVLEREVEGLEEERAKLKQKIRFIGLVWDSNEFGKGSLTQEQRLMVAQYAQNLYEGKNELPREDYELKKENQNLRNKIDMLEKQLQSVNIDSSYKLFNINDNSGNENNVFR